jgi:hypothetical protein
MSPFSDTRATPAIDGISMAVTGIEFEVDDSSGRHSHVLQDIQASVQSHADRMCDLMTCLPDYSTKQVFQALSSLSSMLHVVCLCACAPVLINSAQNSTINNQQQAQRKLQLRDVQVVSHCELSLGLRVCRTVVHLHVISTHVTLNSQCCLMLSRGEEQLPIFNPRAVSVWEKLGTILNL